MQDSEKHEIDISGRLEILDKPTVLAIGGPIHNFAVCITSECKVKLTELFGYSQMGKRRKANFNHTVFSVLLLEVIKSCPEETFEIILDRDYDPKRMRRAK